MKFCPKFTTFSEYIYDINNKVIIDRDADKDLRFDVWSTTAANVREMFTRKGTKDLKKNSNSNHVLNKVEGALSRINENPTSAVDFMTDIINDEANIEYSIAMHEVMESIKGEADKARNLGIDISTISDSGNLPSLPLGRVASSIGRKIAYQQGFRFKTNKTDKKTAAEIETLYYAVGKKALTELEEKGYVKLHSNLETIKDYIDVNELQKTRVETGKLTNKVLSLTINEEKMGITGEAEQKYFLARSDSDISDTKLGAIADILSAVRQVTQPATIVIADSAATKSMEELAANDDPNIKIDKKTEKVRKEIYDRPLYVNNTVHGLMSLLHAETTNKKSEHFGKSGSAVIKSSLSGHDDIINSLFGLQRSDDFSIDKKESITGQNLSKTTPLDDTVENYGIIQGGDFTKASPMHMTMRIGRNARLYYENSVLNPHASKHSRYMLTSGEQTVDSKGDKFDYLVYGISQALGDKDLSYADFTGQTDSKLDEGLELLSAYESSTDLDGKLTALSDMSLVFPGVDYVSLLTTMKAVQDIRNPVDGKVTTEFNVSADATASGGTLTFLQALGTNDNIEEFLMRLGLLNGGEVDINDIYGIMSESIDKFVKGEKVKGLKAQDTSTDGIRSMMEQTVELLFGTDPGDVRELSKDPTMTFVYSQGRKGAIETMSRKLADRIINNLDDPKVRKYLGQLFDDISYRDNKNLIAQKDLYADIVHQLTAAESNKRIPEQLYNILDASINKEYLAEFKARSNRVNKFVQMIESKVPFKILPAGAKLSGAKSTMADIQKFGMPLTKIMEVSNPTEPGQPDTVLTRVQKLTKSVADVSPIHGIDAAQLYHSLLQEMQADGIVAVHDDIRGTVDQVMAMESAYRETTKKIVAEYDVHQAIMNSVAAYDPEIAKDPDFIALMGEIEADVAKKATIMENFNDDTNALIGDGDKYKDFAGIKAEAKPAKPAKAKAKKAAPKKKSQPDLKEFTDKVAPKSPLLTKLIESSKGFVLGSHKKGDHYSSFKDTVFITGKDPKNARTEKENDLLDLNNEADLDQQVQIIDHEIIHYYTIPFMKSVMEGKGSKQEKAQLNYIEKGMSSLNDLRHTADLSDAAQARVDYIFAQPDEFSQLQEFVAVMGGEPEVANELYKVIGKRTPKNALMKSIQGFIEKVKQAFLSLTPQDFLNDVDVDKLQTALMNTIIGGMNTREQLGEAFDSLKGDQTAGFGPVNAANKAVDASRGVLNYANYALSAVLTAQMENRGRNAAKSVHDALIAMSPLYVDAAEKLSGVYDSSEALQQIVHTITGQGTDKTKKANILAKFAKVMGEQSEIINAQMGKFNTLMSGMDDKQKKTIGRFVTEMPLHDYFVLAGNFKTEEAIASEVSRLEKGLGKKSQAVKDVNNLIAWNVHGKATSGGIYNLDARYPMGDSEFGENVRRLLALKSIQEIGSKDFVKFLENKDLVNIIRDSVIANKLSLLENGGTSKLNDSLVIDEYKEPFQIKAITTDELSMYEYGENTGWEVLEKPTKDTLGIVWRKTIDSSSIPGAYTDTKLKSGDIDVTGKKAEYMGVVETTDGAKLRLTKKQKQKLGLVEDFTQGLVRGTAHNMAIQESQEIRDALLQEDTRIVLGKDLTVLEDIIKSKNADNPWFVKMKEGMSYNDMSAEIRAKYKPVGNKASDIKGFNENVDLVRKDISHWLLGGSAKSLFTNPKYKWIMRITKDLVAGAKIGMVVMNPMKIAKDNVSNLSYLGVMGVDPRFIAKNYKDISMDYQKYTDLQRQILQRKVQLVARPNSKKIKNQIKTLQNRLSKNSLGDLGEKGFVNSLGSDLVAKNADTLSGLQADMHKALEYLLLNKDGKKNLVSHFILRLQALGFEGEDFLKYIGKFTKRSDTGAGVQKELDQVYDRLKEIRSDEDIINYVAQFTNSPGSEAVRIGSSMTDLTDVMAKETLWRHLTENENMSNEDARIKVLDSFPDYKENMPLAIKQLSDVGIIMFPSFWLRIQKVIYRMARDKPINLATELMLEEAVGSNVNTILDANIVNKSQAFGSILHTPLEPIGVGSAFPMHIW